MQVNNISALNFKSKINIVSPKYYDAVIRTMERDLAYQNIFRWFLSDNSKYPKIFNAFRKNSKLVSTEEIRSCTAGFWVSAKENLAKLACHIYDSEESIEKVSFLKPFIKGTNGLLVGAREQYKDSFPLFEKLLGYARESAIPMTIMKGLKGMWEAEVAYDATGDEFYLCIKDIQYNKRYVKSEEEFKDAFEEIIISPTDTIEFVAK